MLLRLSTWAQWMISTPPKHNDITAGETVKISYGRIKNKKSNGRISLRSASKILPQSTGGSDFSQGTCFLCNLAKQTEPFRFQTHQHCYLYFNFEILKMKNVFFFFFYDCTKSKMYFHHGTRSNSLICSGDIFWTDPPGLVFLQVGRLEVFIRLTQSVCAARDLMRRQQRPAGSR